jgi:porin
VPALLIRRFDSYRRWLVVLSSATAATLPTRAQEASSWLDAPDATRDWGGARHWLDVHGLHIDLDYTAESFGTAEPGTEGLRAGYRGTIDLMLTLDTALLELWSGGTLFIFAQHGHGQNVSDELATTMPVSNLEAPPFTQLSELWFEQTAASERVLVRVGKQDANRDFGAPRFPGNFIHSSYGVLPTIPMPSFPAPGLGAVVHVDPQPWLGVRAGLYDVAPRIGSLALLSAFRSGVFVIASVVVRHAIVGHPDGAHYGVGAWYAQRDATEAISPSSGGFLIVDFWFPVEQDEGRSARTLQTFARSGWTQRAPGTIDFYAGGGVTYHLPQADDTIGIGAGHVTFLQAVTADHASESFIEMFYKQRFTPWFALQPDVQVVVTPGGARRTVWVGGARLKLKL